MNTITLDAWHAEMVNMQDRINALRRKLDAAREVPAKTPREARSRSHQVDLLTAKLARLRGAQEKLFRAKNVDF